MHPDAAGGFLHPSSNLQEVPAEGLNLEMTPGSAPQVIPES